MLHNRILLAVFATLATGWAVAEAAEFRLRRGSSGLAPTAVPETCATTRASCQAHKTFGCLTSGDFPVDPDGAGGAPSFNAYCEMSASPAQQFPAGGTIASGLLSYWPMNGNWTDVVVGRNATPSGSISFVSGLFGQQAADFPGNAFASLPGGWMAINNSPRTTAFWAKSDGTLSGYVFSWGGNGNNLLWGTTWNYDTVPQRIWLQGHGAGDVMSAVYPTPGQWYHVVQTYDGTTAAIYVDGVLSASGARSLGTSNSNIYFGVYVDGSSAPFDGKVQDMAVWNRAITPTEVAALYAHGATNGQPLRK